MEPSAKKEVLTGIPKERLTSILEDFRSVGAEVKAMPESGGTFRVEAIHWSSSDSRKES